MRGLIETTEGADLEFAAVLRHRTAKGMPRCELHQLGEDELPGMHDVLPAKAGKPAEYRPWRSNQEPAEIATAGADSD